MPCPGFLQFSPNPARVGASYPGGRVKWWRPGRLGVAPGFASDDYGFFFLGEFSSLTPSGVAWEWPHSDEVGEGRD